jgi:hypothetical protein
MVEGGLLKRKRLRVPAEREDPKIVRFLVSRRGMEDELPIWRPTGWSFVHVAGVTCAGGVLFWKFRLISGIDSKQTNVS